MIAGATLIKKCPDFRHYERSFWWGITVHVEADWIFPERKQKQIRIVEGKLVEVFLKSQRESTTNSNSVYYVTAKSLR